MNGVLMIVLPVVVLKCDGGNVAFLNSLSKIVIIHIADALKN